MEPQANTPIKVAPKVLSWATDLDDRTIGQAARSAELPFIHQHVALMPDAHLGYGATVGSVIATKGAIIPSAVGVDIGCGMIAAQLDLTAGDLPDNLQPLHDLITQAVPAGVGRGHQTAQNAPAPAMTGDWWNDRLIEKSAKQFGSLGSGNHFVEICLDENNQVWAVLHSGSRGVGNELAQRHIEGARGLMERYFINLRDPDLAYLVEGTPEFDAYITDMLWAQDWAMGNRQQMMTEVLHSIVTALGHPIDVVDTINCHHNFCEREHHMGADVWVTRKGAIRARTGDRGIIPGSMGARSYVVSGAGHVASFTSCSHGAGRRMSRSQARRELDRDGLIEAMAGKAWNGDAEALIDEDPRAYKDIDEVMANQRDLVTIEHELHQVLNYKGT
ncbi:MAG: RtcB family protein [Acidimicrobiia bacterium]|nr:RtcB family protein [Acidimicrobiia bacterium]MBP8179449.1 RtcB family protein [Acidimicrobiia bacterium]